MLADIVSKNGNLLLNVVLYPDGDLPPESQTFVDEMAVWMRVNAEAIHGTRPWTIFGEGPTETAGGAFHENPAYTAQDVRFTTRKGKLYAITLGEPRGGVRLTSLGARAQSQRVRQVELLGGGGPLGFRQTDAALVIDLPPTLPTRHASAFRITLDG
jgi:alpha-L-fucosidase